jgi:uncharacterized membrane protein YoaK (UPF0700 family)
LLALTPEPPDEPAAPRDHPASAAGDAPSNRHPLESLRHPLTRVLLALTFSTGLVDAASYLGLGHVFAANMTGNVVLLGFGIAGAGGLPVVAPLVSLAAFLLGAWLGGRLGARRAGGTPRHLAAALTVEAGMLLAATVLAAAVHVRAGAFSAVAVIALLAMGMGARNAAVRALGVPDLTTTVLTMTLTALAAELGSVRGRAPGSVRRMAAVISMLAGALVGALLQKTSVALVLGIATALAVITFGVCRSSATDAQPAARSASSPR